MPPKKVQNQLKPAPLPSSSSAVVPTRTPPTPPPPPTPPGAKEDPRLVPVILGEEYDVPSGEGSRAESAEEPVDVRVATRQERGPPPPKTMGARIHPVGEAAVEEKNSVGEEEESEAVGEGSDDSTMLPLPWELDGDEYANFLDGILRSMEEDWDEDPDAPQAWINRCGRDNTTRGNEFLRHLRPPTADFLHLQLDSRGQLRLQIPEGRTLSDNRRELYRMFLSDADDVYRYSLKLAAQAAVEVGQSSSSSQPARVSTRKRQPPPSAPTPQPESSKRMRTGTPRVSVAETAVSFATPQQFWSAAADAALASASAGATDTPLVSTPATSSLAPMETPSRPTGGVQGSHASRDAVLRSERLVLKGMSAKQLEDFHTHLLFQRSHLEDSVLFRKTLMGNFYVEYERRLQLLGSATTGLTPREAARWFDPEVYSWDSFIRDLDTIKKRAAATATERYERSHLSDTLKMVRIGKVDLKADPPDGKFCDTIAQMLATATAEERSALELEERDVVEHLVMNGTKAGDKHDKPGYAGARDVHAAMRRWWEGLSEADKNSASVNWFVAQLREYLAGLVATLRDLDARFEIGVPWATGPTTAGAWTAPDKSRTKETKSRTQEREPQKRCTFCGSRTHDKSVCFFRDHPNAAKEGEVWWETPQGIEYENTYGFHRLLKNVTLEKLRSGEVEPYDKDKRPSYDKVEKQAARGPSTPKQGNNNKSKAIEILATVGSYVESDSIVSCAISVRGKEITVRALVDTGALASSYIHPDVAATLSDYGLQRFPCRATVCGATGTCAQCLGTMYIDVNIRSSVFTIPIDSLKVNIVGMPYDVIIGLPDIKRFDLTRRLRHLFVGSGLEERGELDEYQRETQALCSVDIREVQDAWPVPMSLADIIERRYKEVRSIVVPAHKILGPSAAEEPDEWLPGEENDLLSAISESSCGTLVGDEVAAWPGAADATLPQVDGDDDAATAIRALVAEFAHIFRKTVAKEPCDVPPMRIEFDEDKWAEYRRSFQTTQYRRQSQEKNDEIMRQIQLMLSLGVIVPSTSETYSQVLLAPKPNGKWRFCIDYRKLNDCIKSMHWPLPNISEMLDRIGAARPVWFAVIDLTSGYHQIPLAPESQDACSFITAFGLYKPVRVAFGIKTAPSYFQKNVAGTVMRGLNHDIVEMYIDDILVHARTFEDYLSNLRKVFTRLSQYKITVNPEKCKLGLRSVEFVGRLIGEGTISIVPAKITKALDFVKPVTLRELQSFLGLVNFFHEHIGRFSDKIHPLFDLLKKAKDNKNRVPWDAVYTRYFEEVKKAICENEKLYFYNPDHGQICIDTDASDYAIGAVCYQERIVPAVGPTEGLTVAATDSTASVASDAYRVERFPIKYFAASLNDVQRRWPTIEKEAYAIVRAFICFDYLIRDKHFRLRTDHKNLSYFNLDNAKVTRWKIGIQGYSFDLEYLEGPKNVAADALSRLLQTGWSVKEEVMLMSLPNKEQRQAMFDKVHGNFVGHFGVERTLKRLKCLPNYKSTMEIWEGNVAKYVRQLCAQCPLCQKRSRIHPVIRAMRFTTSSYMPMQRLAIDAVGPLDVAADGSQHIVVIIDCFTRFVELYAAKSTTADEAAHCLLDFVGRYGCPEEIISDGGKQFVNRTINKMSEMTGIDFSYILPGSKEEAAIVERVNLEVVRHLFPFVQHQRVRKKWRLLLPLIQRILNSEPHSSLGVSPAQLLFGNAVNLERPIFLSDTVDGKLPPVKNVARWMDTMLAEQQMLFEVAAEILKSKDDKHLSATASDVPPTAYPVGAVVVIAPPRSAMGRRPETKLSPYWRGPFRVLDVTNSTYTVVNLATKKTERHHVYDLKPFVYDPSKTSEDDLVRLAQADDEQWEVEKILAHSGDPKRRMNLDFLVKWKGLDDPSFNSWLEWKELRDNTALHEYLRTTQELKHLAPKKGRYQPEGGEEELPNDSSARASEKYRYEQVIAAVSERSSSDRVSDKTSEPHSCACGGAAHPPAGGATRPLVATCATCAAQPLNAIATAPKRRLAHEFGVDPRVGVRHLPLPRRPHKG